MGGQTTGDMTDSGGGIVLRLHMSRKGPERYSIVIEISQAAPLFRTFDHFRAASAGVYT
jgi:hypothetical protein